MLKIRFKWYIDYGEVMIVFIDNYYFYGLIFLILKGIFYILKDKYKYNL